VVITLLLSKIDDTVLKHIHKEERSDVFFNIIRVTKSRRMRWEEPVARMGYRRDAYNVLVGKPESKSPIAGPRRRW
jgi:hypothetical protein